MKVVVQHQFARPAPVALRERRDDQLVLGHGLDPAGLGFQRVVPSAPRPDEKGGMGRFQRCIAGERNEPDMNVVVEAGIVPATIGPVVLGHEVVQASNSIESGLIHPLGGELEGVALQSGDDVDQRNKAFQRVI